MGFWPSLPIHIPASPGMPILWDIVWWLFQTVIMGILLYYLRSVAIKIDHVRDGQISQQGAIVQDGGPRTPTL